MKLKTLLLGSAAAMIAVSGARAADAVVAEPEPVDYVRVCDMYGAGFYYIPGTETCLSFSGYVRVDYTYNDNDNADSTSTWNYRARFNIDARNETDWGTLRSQIRFQGDSDGGTDAITGVDRALISIAADGGLLQFGYSDAFNTTFHGYGTFNEKYDGYYSYDQAIFLDYTYSANGFTAAVGIQDSIADSADGAHNNIDLYAGLGYAGSWGNIKASYLYEDATEEGYWKVSSDLNLIENLSLTGFFMYDGEDGANTTAAVAAGDYHWGIGARYQIASDLSADINYSDGDENTGGVEVVPGEFTVGVRWNPIPGLSIRPTAAFRDNDTSSYSLRVYRTW